MKKSNATLIVVTSHDHISPSHPTGLWFEEFSLPVKIFRDAGIPLTVASLQGGLAPIDPKSQPENDADMHTRFALEMLQDTKVLNKLDFDEYAGVFFPGGHGTMFDLADNELVGALVAHFIESGKVVAAVCHGPAALVNAKLRDGTAAVNGRRLTAFTNAEERDAELDRLMPFLLQTRLQDLGADFVASANWGDNVVVDANLITGQNPQSSASTARATLNNLARMGVS